MQLTGVKGDQFRINWRNWPKGVVGNTGSRRSRETGKATEKLGTRCNRINWR
jgi:hypothetical protein